MEMTVTVTERSTETSTLELRKRYWTVGAMTSAVAAIASGAVGLLIALCTYVGLVARGSGMSVAGTLLIAAAFPLMLLTGHCMDGIAKAKQAIRIENAETIGFRK